MCLASQLATPVVIVFLGVLVSNPLFVHFQVMEMLKIARRPDAGLPLSDEMLFCGAAVKCQSAGATAGRVGGGKFLGQEVGGVVIKEQYF